MVKEIKDKSVVLQGPDGVKREVPCGLVVWAAVSTPTFAVEFDTNLYNNPQG